MEAVKIYNPIPACEEKAYEVALLMNMRTL